MKNILMALGALFICLAAQPAAAQTAVTKEQANTYYSNCVQQKDPRFTGQSQQMFCACTAARMTQSFSQEDMKAMVGQDPATARPAANKMLINVYAPCIETPAREYHYAQCINNPQTARLSSNPQGLCKCASDKIASFLNANAQKSFREILARDPNIADPMSALFEDAEFKSFAAKQLLSCAQ